MATFRIRSHTIAAVIGASASALLAGTVGAQSIAACWIPSVGALYVIKETGLPADCVSTTHKQVSLGIATTTNTSLQIVGPHAEFRVHPFFTPGAGTVLVGTWEGKQAAPQVRYLGAPGVGFFDLGQGGTGGFVVENNDNVRFSIADAVNGSSTLFSDGVGGPLTSTGANEFAVRASGGIRLRSNTALTTGCNLAPGSGTWACTSSRSAKEAFEPVNTERILSRIAALPIQRWSYRGQDSTTRHIGPFAEDFHRAFGVGGGPTTISTVDADGVSLAGIQALELRTRKLAEENVELRARLTALEALIARQSPPKER